jgi:antigen flippase
MSSIPANTHILAPLAPPPEVTEKVATADKSSYGQILKSSAMIGGSSLMNILIGIIRTKAVAVILGPTGVGLAGLYGSIVDLGVSVAGMGVNSSGVRQIAEAVGTADKERIARTAAVVRRTSVVLAVLGAVLLLAFSQQMSELTFGSTQYAIPVSLLSLAVFFRLISNGQSALLQGMRCISDLARMNVVGAALGTCTTVAILYFFGEPGVAPSIVGVGATLLIASWWYSRKIAVPTLSINASETAAEAAALLKLGFSFMASALMMMGSAYAVRLIVFHKVGSEATGLYQSAWTLGGLYIGIILQAMGADFYPRLTAAAKDNAACNRLVNEQARVGLLLAGPGIIATLTFAPIVIALFYSSKFGGAVDILRWICLGVALRVITWPMGFIIIAKGEQLLFFWSELAWTLVNVGLTWLCVSYLGVAGAGVAFFGSYIFHAFLIYPIVRHLSQFHWSAENRKTGLLFISSIAVVFCAFVMLPFLFAVVLGILAAFLTGLYSIRVLLTLLCFDQIPRPIGELLTRFGFAPVIAERAP